MTKITVQFSSKLYGQFEKYVGSEAMIRRDAFVEAAIRAELPRLDEAMEGKRLTTKARRYIADELQKWVAGIPDEMMLVNMSIATDVAERLNHRVEQSRMCRDAFFNRLLMLLVGSPGLLKWLALPEALSHEEPHSDSIHVFERDEPVSPMKAVQGLLNDPLKNLHALAEERWNANLWGVPMPVNLHGLSCWIDDVNVPNTRGSKKLERAMSDPDAILRALDRAFETETSSNANRSERRQ